jgi:hypothetical protein
MWPTVVIIEVGAAATKIRYMRTTVGLLLVFDAVKELLVIDETISPLVAPRLLGPRTHETLS